MAKCQKREQNGKQILQYLICFKEYFDKWLMGNLLKNAAEPKKKKEKCKRKPVNESATVSATVSATFLLKDVAMSQPLNLQCIPTEHIK